MKTLRIIEGVRIELSDESARKVAQAISAKVECVDVAGNLVRTRYIIGIFGDEAERTAAKSGRLHDGTQVVKRFGEWRDAGNPDVNLDPGSYPEAARDEVMTDAQWSREIAHLPHAEREARYHALLLAAGRPQLPPGR